MWNLIPTEYWDYGPTDMAKGLLAVLSFRKASALTQIDIPGVGSCHTIRSARAAIVMALKALGCERGASVAVPLYCCPVVLRAISEVGAQACFIDIDPATYCMSACDLAAKNSEVDIVIAVHMFGNMCDMPALRRAAPGKPIIEDCAQALGSRLQDRNAGSFGDIAVFSFRSGKYISVGEGGAIRCNRSDLESRFSDLLRRLSAPSRADEVIHVVKTCLRSMLRKKPLWGLVGSWLWGAYSQTVDLMSQAPIVLGTIYESDRLLAVQRLGVLSMIIDKHRSNANHYLENLAVNPSMLCFETPGASFNRLQFSLRAPNAASCCHLQDRLLANHISTSRPYKDIASIAAEHYGYKGNCPVSEQVAKTVLVIPCNYSLQASEVEWISNAVNRAWAEVSASTTDETAPCSLTRTAVS